MPDSARFVISDNISQRYARARLIAYGAAGAGFLLYFACLALLQPSFALLATISLIFALLLVVCVLHNPLGLLTMRAQIKIAVSEIIFDQQGFSALSPEGGSLRFENPALEIFFIPGPGGSDYYLQARDENGKSGSFYLGNEPGEIEPMVKLLEEGGLRAKYEAAQVQRNKSLNEQYEKI